MKPIFTFLLFGIISFTSQAQNWVHQGSVWRYYGVSLGGPSYTQYNYSKDTTVDNQICKQLLTTYYQDQDSAPLIPIYTYAASDTVFFYYQNEHTWHGTYFFGAHPGDTIGVPNYSNSATPDTLPNAIVDSVGIIVIDTFHLRSYQFHLIDSCWLAGHVFRARVIERIGILSNIMIPNWACATDDTYYHLCSYQDDSLQIYLPYGNCPLLPNGLTEILQVDFQLQPNPAQEDLEIILSENPINTKLHIASMDGKEVINQLLQSNHNRISLSSIASGPYMVTIIQNGYRSATKKLIVSH